MGKLDQIKVCYFGTYRENYSRNQMMIAGLQINSVEVSTCHETLWHGIDDRVMVASGGWKNPAFWGRLIQTYWRLICQFFRMNEFDILVVGYPGQLDVYLARLLAWVKHKPMAWDIFMSLYLISTERGIQKKSRLSIKLLKAIEHLALRLPDLLILDTLDYAEWFSAVYGIKSSKIKLVPTGADNRYFLPYPETDTTNEKFIVLYAGTFIPNHGVMYIVDAARILNDYHEIEFYLIGEGPDLENARQFVEKYQLNNVRFIEWLKRDDLINWISQADVCLGAFGLTPQSMMTVQNKIYEALAMRKALISGDSPAIRRVCTHEENILLCERENGSAIADAILTLWKNPSLRSTIAQNGYKLFTERYNLENNGKLFKEYLKKLIE